MNSRAVAPDMRRPLFRSVRGVLLALLVGSALCAGLNGIVRHLGDPARYPLLGRHLLPYWTTFRPQIEQYAAILRHRPADVGDYRPVYRAADAWRRDARADLYDPAELARGRSAFVYTPLAAVFVAALATGSEGLDEAAARMHALNRLLWLGGGALLLGLLGYRRRLGAGVVLTFALAYLLCYPLAEGLFLTQIQIPIWCAAVLSVFLLQRGRDVPAGIALACAISIKPHLCLVPVLLACAPRARLRFLLACGGALVALALLALALAGWANLRVYVTDVLPALSAGYAYYPNQSLNGLLLRLGAYAPAAVYDLAPAVPAIRLAAIGFAVAVLATTVIALRRARHDDDGTLALALALAAATLASPVTWPHHLGLLLPGCVLIARSAGAGPALQAVACAGYLLLASYVDGSRMNGFPLALLSVFPWLGALLIWSVLLRLLASRASGAA